MTSEGCDQGGYYHELFLRGKPFLTKHIRKFKRGEATERKEKGLPEEEPDLYTFPYVGETSEDDECKKTSTHVPTGAQLAAPAPAPFHLVDLLQQSAAQNAARIQAEALLEQQMRQSALLPSSTVITRASLLGHPLLSYGNSYLSMPAQGVDAIDASHLYELAHPGLRLSLPSDQITRNPTIPLGSFGQSFDSSLPPYLSLGSLNQRAMLTEELLRRQTSHLSEMTAFNGLAPSAVQQPAINPGMQGIGVFSDPGNKYSGDVASESPEEASAQQPTRTFHEGKGKEKQG